MGVKVILITRSESYDVLPRRHQQFGITQLTRISTQTLLTSMHKILGKPSDFREVLVIYQYFHSSVAAFFVLQQAVSCDA